LASFFLCERLPVLVRFGVDVPEEERTAGVRGRVGCEMVGGEESAERASKSERWLANVFWERRILRTAGVTLPWLTIITPCTLAIIRHVDRGKENLPRPALSRCRLGTGMLTSRWFSRSKAASSRSIFASCFAAVSCWLAGRSLRVRFREEGCEAARGPTGTYIQPGAVAFELEFRTSRTPKSIVCKLGGINRVDF
jgi:hypothetical protein